MSDHALTWGETPTNDDKLWGALAHLSCFTGFVILGPIVVMLLFGEKSPYVKYHAMQAIVGQVAVVIVGFVASLAISLLSFVTCGFGGLLFFALPLLGLVPLWGAWIAWNAKWEGFPMLTDFGKPK
jgi:hypothetical protein